MGRASTFRWPKMFKDAGEDVRVVSYVRGRQCGFRYQDYGAGLENSQFSG